MKREDLKVGDIILSDADNVYEVIGFYHDETVVRLNKAVTSPRRTIVGKFYPLGPQALRYYRKKPQTKQVVIDIYVNGKDDILVRPFPSAVQADEYRNGTTNIHKERIIKEIEIE